LLCGEPNNGLIAAVTIIKRIATGCEMDRLIDKVGRDESSAAGSRDSIILVYSIGVTVCHIK